MPPRLGARAFRALLRLYPAAFRDEYGREMSLVFADRSRDAAGPMDRVRLWTDALVGVVTEAFKEHVRLAGHDLQYAWRRLRMSPWFATTSVATLALAMGASTTMFSVLNGVLLRPLPFASPERLALVWTDVEGRGVGEGRSGYWNVEQWRARSRSFAELAVFDPVSVTWTQADTLEQISVVRTSANFFPLLGLAPAVGRVFSEREAEERQRVAIISHRFWQARLGGSREAIGTSLLLDGRPSRVIGIMPDAIGHVLGADVWEPQTLFPDWDTRRSASGAGSWFVVGRLAPDVSLERAQADINALARQSDGAVTAGGLTRTIRVMPLSRHITGARPRLVLWMLAAASVLLLLVAAANAAGLSLARGVGRVPEMAIRAALGASQARIARLLLAESLTVAALAGVLGLLLAALGITAIKAVGPAQLARLQEVSLDLRAFAWALAVSVVTGALVGLAPATTIWRRDLRAAGVEGGRGIAGGAATGLRRLLVIAECAAAMILLTGAGLLVRSWFNVMQVDAGFRAERVLSLAVATPAGMDGGRRSPFYDLLLERVSAVPGVERAGVSSELFVGAVAEQLVTTDGTDRDAASSLPLRRDEIAGALFDALGTPLLRGRVFSATDGLRATPVAIINDVMARRVWGSHDPVGRRFALGDAGPRASWFTVVGVVGNMRRQGLETEPIPQMFEPMAQNPSRRAILFVRTAVDPLQLVAPIRAAVREVDAQAFVYGVTTVDARLSALVSPRRVQTWLLAGCSLVALLLATVGLSGLIQYSVAARTHEIGVRMALGARAGDIFRMVVREGLVLSLAGLAVGLVGALWLGRAASALLFGVSAADPATLAAMSLLLMTVTTSACYVPARRAMGVAPVVALRARVT